MRRYQRQYEMRLVFGPDALRDLKGLERKLAERILRRMEQVAADPFGRHPQAKPLQGEGRRFRLRIGNWRVLYVVDRDQDAVEVVRIKSRQGAYK